MAVEKDPDWFLGFSFASFRVFPWSMATSARVMMWPLCCLSISPLDSPRHNLPPLPNSTSGLRAALGSATPGKLQTITTLVFFLGIFLLLLIYWFNSISTMDASIHFNVISGIFKTWKKCRFQKAKLLTQQVKKVYTDLTMVAAVANPLMDFWPKPVLRAV